MQTITLKMLDELNNKEVERTIDGSNMYVNNTAALPGWECNRIGTNEEIEKNLNVWINEIGNDQHETILTLISWKINKN
jgi:hypothetical protein